MANNFNQPENLNSLTEQEYGQLYIKRTQDFYRQQMTFDLIGIALIVIGLLFILTPLGRHDASSDISDECRAALAAANGNYQNMAGQDACYGSSTTSAGLSFPLRPLGTWMTILGVGIWGTSLRYDPRQMPLRNASYPSTWTLPVIPPEDVKRNYIAYVKGLREKQRQRRTARTQSPPGQ